MLEKPSNGNSICYLLLTPSRKGRIFDIGAERKSGREARRIDYFSEFSVFSVAISIDYFCGFFDQKRW